MDSNEKILLMNVKFFSTVSRQQLRDKHKQEDSAVVSGFLDLSHQHSSSSYNFSTSHLLLLLPHSSIAPVPTSFTYLRLLFSLFLLFLSIPLFFYCPPAALTLLRFLSCFLSGFPLFLFSCFTSPPSLPPLLPSFTFPPLLLLQPCWPDESHPAITEHTTPPPHPDSCTCRTSHLQPPASGSRKCHQGRDLWTESLGGSITGHQETRDDKRLRKRSLARGAKPAKLFDLWATVGSTVCQRGVALCFGEPTNRRKQPVMGYKVENLLLLYQCKIKQKSLKHQEQRRTC